MDRTEKILHFIASLAHPSLLGRVKIAKILWLSDVEAKRSLGLTISGSDNYVKDEHGPRHKDFYPNMDNLKASGKLKERQAYTPAGPRNEYDSLQEPDISCFTDAEIKIIKDVVARIAPLTARQASELTHDALWKAAFFGERIPVAAACPVLGEMSPEIMNWAEAVHNEHSEAP